MGPSNVLNRSTKLSISGSVCAMLNGRTSYEPSALRIATVLLDFDTSIPTAIMRIPPVRDIVIGASASLSAHNSSLNGSDPSSQLA